MPAYRKLVKQIHRLYAQNKSLTKYMLTVLKSNTRLLAAIEQSRLEQIGNQFSALFQILLTAQSKKPVVEIKKQLHLSFISHPFFQFPVHNLSEAPFSQAFRVLAWTQFYYLLYFKKIFPKKVIGDRGAWTELVDELDGRISWRDTSTTIRIFVPRAGDKLTAIL